MLKKIVRNAKEGFVKAETNYRYKGEGFFIYDKHLIS